MGAGAVIVDVAIDQGGIFETSRPTTHADPVYRRGGRRTLLRRQHAGRGAADLDLRADGGDAALRPQPREPGRPQGALQRPALAKGLMVRNGELLNEGVAAALNAG